jgi:omega-hydroxy-beta-dihydromenaquinone-9 sulfotransferase
MILKRILRVYLIIGRTFQSWLSPIITGCLILLLRLTVGLFRILDHIFFFSFRKSITEPIIIVGNPRSGTTFLHRFLIKQRLGEGSQLWQMVYPSIILQKIIKPFLPIMERISPARHHSTEAHKTSLKGIETDDVSLLFRYFDGFFLYGFFLTFDKEDLFNWIDPKIRDTSKRDFLWFESMWKRNLFTNDGERYIGKLFSLSGNLPAFQKKFPDSKILYMIRDPLNLIPSGISLVTGVLDKKFNFWSLDKKIKDRFIERLYNALVILMNRFHDDWTKGNINKKNVYLVRFDIMMSDFENLMDEILKFIKIEKNSKLASSIKKTAQSQKAYKSEHKYDLKKFGLTEKQIKKDCINIYKTFLN